MPYKYEKILRRKASELVAELGRKDFNAWIAPESVREYMIKIFIQSYGNINLYYSPSKDGFRITGHELRDKTVLPQILSCWDRVSNTETSAESFDNSVSLNESTKPSLITTQTSVTEYQAYVDGSFCDGITGFGAVVLKDNQPVKEFFGLVPPLMEGMRQVGGELQAVVEVIHWCRRNGIGEISIFYDYKGLEQWATGGWKANKDATRWYSHFIRESQIAISWNKVKAHCGDKWNERADCLAKKAVGCQSPSRGAAH